MPELTATIDSDAAVAEITGKYLCFEQAGGRYGIEVLNVREIIAAAPTAPVPGSADYTKSVIGVRGQDVTVVDLGMKLGLDPVAPAEDASIVIVDVSGGAMGLAVDRVLGVIDVDNENITETDQAASGLDEASVLGIAVVDGATVTLLDPAGIAARRVSGGVVD